MPFVEADRLKALPPYLFVHIDRRRAVAQAAGKDVINLGIGDPDQPTPSFVIDRMERAVRNPGHHRYPPDFGYPLLRQEVTAFFRRRYGVELDSQREVLPLIGSKEGLGHLPLAVVNPGQIVLIPDPAYPVYRSASIFAGGQPWMLRMSPESYWLPDLDSIPPNVARQATLMFLNYPNNPTGTVATLQFFANAVEFARRHDLIIAHDAAYNELYLSGERPPSILQVPGAKEVAVEFHSLSKTFNMTGWRLGFVSGSAHVIAALARVKNNLDSGQFAAIQEAGCEAYRGIDRPEIEQIRATYRQRAEILCAGLRAAGFRVDRPRATFYVWAGVPDGYDGMSLAEKLLDESGIVCVPGIGFGEAGARHVRFSLTIDTDRIREAVRRLQTLTW